MREYCVLVATLTLGVLAAGDANAACDGVFQPPDRSSVLQERFKRSVFIFGGGTAYYIGGSPGYLLTAYHVVKDSASTSDQVCSPHYDSSSTSQTCFDVEVVEESLPEWDLALLQLSEPLPSYLTPIEIAASRAPQGSGEQYMIFGFAQPPESSERPWSTSPGPIVLQAPVSSSAGSVPLSDKPVYHVGATQYVGASGGPLLGRHGFAWATAVRAIDANQIAYGIPHNADSVMLWLLRNTKPSVQGAELITLSSESTDTPDERRELQSWLSARLDVSNRVLSHLDLIHLTNSMLSSGRPDAWYRLYTCPISQAAATFVDWDALLARLGGDAAIEMAARTAEYGKEVSWAAAQNVSTEDEKVYYLAKSGDLALRANEHLAKLMPQLNHSSFATLPVVEQDYFTQAGLYFAKQDTPWVSAQYAADAPADDGLYQRYIRNLNDATIAYNSANEIKPSNYAIAKSIVATSLAWNIESRRAVADHQVFTDWGKVRASYVSIPIEKVEAEGYDGGVFTHFLLGLPENSESTGQWIASGIVTASELLRYPAVYLSQDISADKKPVCTFVSIRALGWRSGHKTNFCRANGYPQGNANRGDYKNGGICMAGQSSICEASAFDAVPDGFFCEAEGNRTACFQE